MGRQIRAYGETKTEAWLVWKAEFDQQWQAYHQPFDPARAAVCTALRGPVHSLTINI